MAKGTCCAAVRALDLHGVQVRGKAAVGALVTLLKNFKNIHVLNIGEPHTVARFRSYAEDVEQLDNAIKYTGVAATFVDDTAGKNVRKELRRTIAWHRIKCARHHTSSHAACLPACGPRHRHERRARACFVKTGSVDEALKHAPWRDERTWISSAGDLDQAQSKMGFRLRHWGEEELRRGICATCSVPHKYRYGKDEKSKRGKERPIRLPCAMCAERDEERDASAQQAPSARV